VRLAASHMLKNTAEISHLVEQLNRGCLREPLAELIRIYRPKVFGCAKQVGMPEGDWPDVEQETWISILRYSRERRLRDSTFGALVRIIATSRAKDLLGKLHPAVLLVDEPSVDDGDLEYIDDSDAFEHRISRLDSDHQTIIRLRILQGLSHEEIADHTNLSTDVVEKRWQRLIKRLGGGTRP
jgi:RNA polymerase sigma factor (sigma-70 family)